MAEIRALFTIRGPDVTAPEIEIPRGEFTVGRTSANNLKLDSKQVSRNHLRIFWQDATYWAEDLNSTNGVLLNSNRIMPGVPVRIEPGDGLQVGEFTFIFERLLGLEDEDGEQPPVDEAPVIKHLQELTPSPPVLGRPRAPRPSPSESLVPKVRRQRNMELLPHKRSNWLKYLPAIYSDPDLDPTHFIGRYLLVFESLMNRVTWVIDNFDLYLSPETAPPEWLKWLAS